MQPRLPQELSDMVIDHLHDDKSALVQCTLVCKDWIASSSLHLFQRTNWPPHPNIWRPRSYSIHHEPDSDKAHLPCKDDVYTFSDFLAFLNATPRIRRAIESLSISSLRYPSSGVQEIETLTPEVLLAIVDALPRLCALTLRDCRWQGKSSVHSRSCRVERTFKVQIHNDKVQDRNHLQPLSCFRHIDSLVIRTPEDYPYPQATVLSPTAFICVDFLTVEECGQDYTRVLMDMALPSLVDLRALRGISLDKPPGYYVNQALRTLTNLEHLDITLFHVPRFPLNAFPYLRTLTVRVNLCASASHPWSYAWPALSGTLVQCALPTVTTVNLGLHLHASCACGQSSTNGVTADEVKTFLRSLNWTSLGSAVGKYDALQVLRIMLVAEETVEMTAGHMTSVLSEEFTVPGNATLEVVEGGVSRMM